MIGLSHYPDYNNWNSTASGAVSNYNAARNIAAVSSQFNVPVMIVETGYSQADENKAKQVMQDLFDKTENLPQCAGIFYWEPEVDGQWKPAYYTSTGWGAYGMGAFTADGRPTAALDPFKSDASDIITVLSKNNAPVVWYDLTGRLVSNPAKGIFIKRQGHRSQKVIIP